MTEHDAHLCGGQIRRAMRLSAAGLAMAVLLGLTGCGSQHAAGRSQSTTTAAAPASRPVGQYFPSDQPPAAAQVTISSHEKMSAIPRSYFGLSTEYWTLPTDELHVALYKRVLALIHVPGDGPFVLRVGGDSSDRSFWDPDIRRLPHWAFEVTPDFVERTARIVRAMHLRVIFDMNLITGTPLEAGAWAAAAERDMPKGSILGFEIGNEPDLYDRELWLVNLGGSRFDAGLIPRALTPETYARDYDRYAVVLRRVAPDVPLLAPALANPQLDSSWISRLLAGPHPGSARSACTGIRTRRASDRVRLISRRSTGF